MGNKEFSATALVREAIADLAKRLPRSWSLTADHRPQRNGDRRIDGTATLRGADGTEVVILVETKPTIEARDVPRVASELRGAQSSLSRPSATLLVAPFVSERTRALLDDEAIGYADSTGNIRLQVDQPALFVQSSGAKSNPWRDVREPLKSLRGPSSGRAIRALVDFVPPYGIRELAQRAGTPAPTLSRVAELLARDALLVREGSRGRILEVDWRGTIRRWAQDYSVAKSNRSRSYVAPRGLRPLLQRLETLTSRYAITGSLAANVINPVTEARSATIFVDDAELAAVQLELKPVEAGANVVLAEPYDPVVFERTKSLKRAVYVGASQLAVDLLTGPGRSPSEGEAILQRMGANESEWRF